MPGLPLTNAWLIDFLAFRTTAKRSCHGTFRLRGTDGDTESNTNRCAEMNSPTTSCRFRICIGIAQDRSSFAFMLVCGSQLPHAQVMTLHP